VRRDLTRELKARKARLNDIVKLSPVKLERMPVALIEQLERCRDDAARRLLMLPRSSWR
jgi:hypothetical protein